MRPQLTQRRSVVLAVVDGVRQSARGPPRPSARNQRYTDLLSADFIFFAARDSVIGLPKQIHAAIITLLLENPRVSRKLSRTCGTAHYLRSGHSHCESGHPLNPEATPHVKSRVRVQPGFSRIARASATRFRRCIIGCRKRRNRNFAALFG